MIMPIGACGFTPMYAGNTTATVTEGSGDLVSFQNIAVANIPDRSGQYLRNQLIDTIYIDGIPNAPRYELQMLRLDESITPLGIRRDETATRAQMRITVQMLLVDKTTGTTALTRNLIATNSFNQLRSQYTTNVSNQYARERALDELARQAVTEIALFLKR
tara:strand:- start:1 stop:483 length:483 start_codon:yes stop_codon:yes gene_type:complete